MQQGADSEHGPRTSVRPIGWLWLTLLLAAIVGCDKGPPRNLPRLACAENAVRFEDDKPVHIVTVPELLAQSLPCNGRLVSVGGFLLTTHRSALLFASVLQAEEEAKLRSRNEERALLWVDDYHPSRRAWLRYQLESFSGLRVRVSGRVLAYPDLHAAVLEPVRIDVLDPTERTRGDVVERLLRLLPTDAVGGWISEDSQPMRVDLVDSAHVSRRGRQRRGDRQAPSVPSACQTGAVGR